MITDGKKRHYLAVKRLSALFKGITSKNKGDFYCLNCFQSYKTENKLKKHEKVCENYVYCYVEMPEEDNKILKYNHGEKFMKLPFIIYADLESLLEEMSTCIVILKNHQQLKEINIHALVIHCLHNVHLIQQKISLIITEAKIV